MSKAFEPDSILEFFQDLDDPRGEVNRRHLLGDLLVISVLAVLAGADGPTAISVWANGHADWLKQRLELPNGIPAKDTFRRLLGLLKPSAFQTCFQAWVLSLQSLAEQESKEIIAIDGKSLRRSHDQRNGLGPLHVVSAWAAKLGMSLGQVTTDEKSNEITAIPLLLKEIDVQDAIVTLDAAGCQRNIADSIIESKGDYVLALKGNQRGLHRDVIEYISQHMHNEFADLKSRSCHETVRGHGRVDELAYHHLVAPKELIEKHGWAKLRTIGVAVRSSSDGSQEAYDVRYYISSLSLGVKQFAEAVRKHWSIETTLHWCLDVTFREDESRVRNRIEAANLAWLKRFAIGLLKQQNDKHSIAMRRRLAGWNVDYLSQVVGLKPS